MPNPCLGFASPRGRHAAPLYADLYTADCVDNPDGKDAAAPEAPQTGTDDLGLLVGDHRRERATATVERAVAALRAAGSGCECWSDPPVTKLGRRRAASSPHGALWLAAAFAAFAALAACAGSRPQRSTVASLLGPPGR
ncbi:MAG TPA: hypothetical protein VKV96_15850 [Roseiarcus sp.]|jgi:hypothetical protein|nr:hypothetical protein [Roseiarcus sp.]